MRSFSCVFLASCFFTVGQAAAAAATAEGKAQTVKVGHAVVDKALFASKGQIDKKMEVCAVCHGKNGGGDADFGPTAAFGTPALRGLSADYMVKQLEAFRSGARTHKEMTPMVSLLSKDDALALSKAYAKMQPAALQASARSQSFPPSLIADGELIVKKGANGDAATSCAACHQDRGVGLGDAFPRLAGQNAAYITNQLQAWKDGTRKNPSGQVMVAIAAKLSPEQIKAVAAYYEAQVAR